MDTQDQRVDPVGAGDKLRPVDLGLVRVRGGGCPDDGALPASHAPDLFGMDRRGDVAVTAACQGGGLPQRLVDQIAAEAGTTPHQVRLAIAINLVARRGGTLADACSSTGRCRAVVQRHARRWLIDLADYRPFARAEPRPAAVGRLV